MMHSYLLIIQLRFGLNIRIYYLTTELEYALILEYSDILIFECLWRSWVWILYSQELLPILWLFELGCGLWWIGVLVSTTLRTFPDWYVIVPHRHVGFQRVVSYVRWRMPACEFCSDPIRAPLAGQSALVGWIFSLTLMRFWLEC